MIRFVVFLILIIFYASTVDCATNNTTEAEAANTAVADEINKLISSHKVTLFSKTYCPYSKGIKRILSNYQINDLKVVEIDLRKDGKIVIRELEKISKLHTVPQLFVNKKFVGNFDAVSAMEKDHTLTQILREAQAIE
ncbi:Glutaredoxin domain containing protein [Aphelenchoides besseyi]|nr:Glutaredoxin domain containing protein [Aphelenchoides besseyi]KAI6200963.1 Glutaredoxin domain containing protein [Aphelenchoides besseyi]